LYHKFLPDFFYIYYIFLFVLLSNRPEHTFTSLYVKGIMKLKEQWEGVIEFDGDYAVE